MNYRNIINKGSQILKQHDIITANIDAELLLSISLNKSREQLLLNLEKKLNLNEIKKYFGLINRRKQKEPVSFINGKKFFWKYEFVVNKNVLIPRPETEFLVEEILRTYKEKTNLNILDVGVGSGCILISLLKEKNKWKGEGIDISSLAIKIAKTNAKIQQVENRIRFKNSNIDNFSLKKYDLIVSNPPYINKVRYNNLDLGIKGFEPIIALYGGVDGLKIIEKIIIKSKIILKKNGMLMMEIGLGQQYKVIKLLKNNGFYVSKIIKDYQKIKRCLIAKKI